MKRLKKLYIWLQWKWVYLTTHEAVGEEVDMMDKLIEKHKDKISNVC